jgi:hypothetical protein
MIDLFIGAGLTAALGTGGYFATRVIRNGKDIAVLDTKLSDHEEDHRQLDNRLDRIENKLDRVVEKINA